MKRVSMKIIRRRRRKTGIRQRIMGGPERPRLTVFRSSRHIYAQIVDDLAGRTLVSASSMDRTERPDNGGNCQAAAEVGRRLAERAGEAGIRRVVLDRNGYRYHGRLKALSAAAREGGLEF